MNKTLSIGLAGYSFMIEEHAYIKLSDYLSALRSTLDVNEADEVMHDIEIRIVEIFRDSLNKREVVNDADVEKVIAQIGTPEIIEEQEEAYFSDKSKEQKAKQDFVYTDKKQLFRDPEQQKIAGVCAGLANYIGLDLRTMRAIWLGIFILGIFTAAISSTLIVIIYIILWIVIPKAESAADFLKMKGKPINFDNLKNESNKLVQFANESTQRVGEIYTENKPYINTAGSGIRNLFKYIIGGFFAMLAIGSIIGIFFIIGLFGVNADFPGSSEFKFYLDDNNLGVVLTVMMVIGALIPALFFSLISIKIFSPKTKLRNIGWVIGGLFFLLIGLGSYFGINMAKKDWILKGYKEDTEEVAINTTSDTIYVDLKQVSIPQNFTAYDDNLYSDKKLVYKKDYVYLEVTRKADIKTPYLIIKKEAKGYNIPLNVSVPVEIINNKVVLPNYIKYPYDHRFRKYSIDYELVIPSNTIVIPQDKNQINYDGDLDNNGKNDRDEYDGQDRDEDDIVIKNDKIIVNGSTIEYNSDDSDSIIVNGKKYPKNKANIIMDSIKQTIKKSSKGLHINIEDGNDKVSIKTK